MPYDHSDGAVVDCVVSVGIEEGRLQDCRGEANLVGGGIIIGVHHLRRHAPFGLVRRLAELVQIVRDIPLAGGEQVLEIALLGIDLEGAVVFPLVGIADLHGEVGELFLGPGLGGVAHPVEGGDVLAKGDLKVLYKLEHLLLAAFGEVFFDVHLADSFAEDAVGDGHCALPAGLLFLHAGHLAAVEVERSGIEIIAEGIRGIADDVGEDIILEHLEVGGSEVGGECLEEGRLGDDYLFLFRNAAGGEISREGEARESLFKLRGAVGIVLCEDVPFLLAGPGIPGEDILHEHGIVGNVLRILNAGKGEHLGKESAVAFLDGGVLLEEIVVAVADSEAALAHIEDLGVAVGEVGFDTCAEEGAHAGVMQFGEQFHQFFLGRNRLNHSHIGLEGFRALIVQANGIETLLVDVHDFLLHAAGSGLHGGHRREEVVQADDVVFVELVEAAETGELRLERVVHLPAMGGVLVEVGPRSHAGVEVAEIQGRNLLCLGLACRQRQNRNHQEKYLFHFFLILLIILRFVSAG